MAETTMFMGNKTRVPNKIKIGKKILKLSGVQKTKTDATLFKNEWKRRGLTVRITKNGSNYILYRG